MIGARDFSNVHPKLILSVHADERLFRRCSALLAATGDEFLLERVDTRAALAGALERDDCALVLVTEPDLQPDTGLIADVIRGHSPDLPFIVLANRNDPQRAIHAIRAGAADFIARRDLARLVPVVEREVRAASRMRRLRAAQRQDLVCEAKFRALADHSLQGLLVHRGRQPLFANDAFARLHGFAGAQEILALPSIAELVAAPPGAEQTGAPGPDAAPQPAPRRFEQAYRRPDGSTVWLELATNPIDWEQAPATLVVAMDVTASRRAEAEARQGQVMFQALLDAVPHPMYVKNAEGVLLSHNRHHADWLEQQGGGTAPGPGQEHAAPAPARHGAFPGADRALLEQGGDGIDRMAQVTGPDGQPHEMLVAKRIIRDTNRDVLGLVGIAIDISNRKRTEAELSAAHARLADAIDSSPAAFYYIDAENRLQLWNRKVLEFFPMLEPYLRVGMPMEEFFRTAAPAYMGPHIDVEAYVAWRMARLAHPPPEAFEYVTAHGHHVLVQDRKSAAGGTVIVTMDITELRRGEQALASSEANFRELMHRAGDGVFLSDGDSRFLHVNSRLCAITGYSEAELLGMSFRELVDTESLRQEPLHMPEIMAGRAMLRVRPLRRKDGSIVVVETSAVVREDRKVLGIVRDITERNRAEQELQQSRRLLQAVFDTIPHHLYVKDAEGRYLMANRAFAEFFRLAEEQPLGKRSDDVLRVAPTELERIHAEDQAVLDGRIARSDIVLDLHFQGGPARKMRTVKTPLRDEAGKIFGLVGISEDVTELELSQAALRDSQRLSQSVFDAVPHLVFVKDRRGRYLAVNRHAAEMMDMPRESFEGLTTSQLPVAKYAEWQAVAETDRRILCGELPRSDVTTTLRYVDGVPRIMRTVKEPLKDDAGRIYGMVGIAEDVTELERSHTALRDSQRLMQSVFDSIPHLINVKDTEGRYLAVNRRTVEMVGLPRERIEGLTLSQLPLAKYEEWRDVAEVDRRILSGELPRSDVTSTLRYEDGVPLIMRVIKEPLKDEAGRIYGMVGIAEDVTELERAHTALRMNERLLDSVFNAIPQPIFVKDTQGHYIVVNPGAARAMGMTPEQLVGKSILETRVSLTPAWQRVMEIDRQIISGELPRSDEVLELRYADGGSHMIRLIKEPIRDESGRICGSVGIAEDVTALHSAKAEVTAAHERLYDAVQHLQAGFALYDRDERLLLWNDRINELFPQLRGKLHEGITIEEIMRLDEPMVEFTEQSTELYIQRRLAEFRHPSRRSQERRLKTGRWVLLRDRKTSEGGTVSLWQDITELKDTEQALRDSERRFRLLTENAPDLIFSYRLWPERAFDYVSPVATSITGYTPVEHYADPDLWQRITHPEDIDQQAAAFSSEAGTSGKLTSVRWQHRDGHWVWIEERCTPVVDATGRLTRIEGIVRDISSRKSLEDQLLQAQRMEAVGQLAGGIAHDFNNMLSVMSSYSAFVLEELPEGSPALDDVKVIQSAVERSAALTRQLLAFSRRQLMQMETVDLNVLVTQMEKILRRVIGEDLALEKRLAPALGHVLADPSQIEQIVMNLAVNARDAMPKGGTLILETENVQVGDEIVSRHPDMKPGPHVKLAVTDTGVGMTDDVQRHIFEPFFTTKEVGKGTGLGLSTVYGIVKQMGGEIWVNSDPGIGTTFKIFLPCHMPVEDTLAGVLPDEVQGGTETILLVEDEEMVRLAAQRILEEYGYTVVPASNAREAEAIYRMMPERVDLVLTDVVMPESSGPELVQRLLALRPGQPVLFMTGYTESTALGDLGAEGLLDIIQKPFTPMVLLQKIRRVLGTPDG